MRVGWLVSCFGFNGPFRLYVSLYLAVSQREREKEVECERLHETKLKRIKNATSKNRIDGFHNKIVMLIFICKAIYIRRLPFYSFLRVHHNTKWVGNALKLNWGKFLECW